jgi:hypothetical protein
MRTGFLHTMTHTQTHTSQNEGVYLRLGRVGLSIFYVPLGVRMCVCACMCVYVYVCFFHCTQIRIRSGSYFWLCIFISKWRCIFIWRCLCMLNT